MSIHSLHACRPWKKVAVADDFLLGLTEPGFQDLEMLDTSNYSILGDDIRALIERADEAAAHRCAHAARRAACSELVIEDMFRRG